MILKNLFNEIICSFVEHDFMGWRYYFATGIQEPFLTFNFKKRVCFRCTKEEWEQVVDSRNIKFRVYDNQDFHEEVQHLKDILRETDRLYSNNLCKAESVECGKWIDSVRRAIAK